MPSVEIDETELSNLRRVAQVADIVAKHPKARALMQDAVALAAPDQVGPETRLRNEFSESLTAIRDEMKADREAREKAIQEREEKDRVAALERRWAAGRAKARDAGWTDEGLKSLEEWMEQKGVADHQIAIPAFERENPPAEPVMTGSQRWNFLENPQAQPDLKALYDGNEEQFLGSTISQTLRDIRGR